jgi:hypothetical protein
MADIKHVGRVISTGKKCIVAYRTLPGESGSCLIIPTENLPDSYHDALINTVESNAGQTAYEFAEALARGLFPDGSNMLSALHTQGRFVKAPTDQIEMLPNNSMSIVLSELNQIIAEQRGTTVDDLSLKTTLDKQINEASKTTSLTEPVAQPTKPEVDVSLLTPEQQAKHYRSEADRLSKEAASLRRQAEELVPTAKKTKTETVVVEEVTTAKKEKVVNAD